MINNKIRLDRVLLGGLILILVFLLQIVLGKTGHFAANIIPYQGIDPYDSFAHISIHHITEMIIALLVVTVLSKIFKIDFYFQMGDKKKGKKAVFIFTGIFVFISVGMHIMLYFNNQLPVYEFPLDIRNIVGTVGFQLFLSGPAEEIIFRALPISMLVFAFGRSIMIKRAVSVEVLISAVLFSLFHASWTLYPFSFQADYFQLFYAFTMGLIQGIVYQKTRSIIYPILIHSISNVLMVSAGYIFSIL